MIHAGVFDRSYYASVADLQYDPDFTCNVHLRFLWIDPTWINEVARWVRLSCLGRSAE